ncbi:hypothetical protein [Bdellovibrio bacteriovorus]|uniref:hypothetical protein n=1 Tax=Bdellovibrio bacteriovorus TaxID=959 RepID=UPI00059FF1C6|nr:hypothetical protein [Bdellovibrio bacteriovorus]
MEEQNVEKDEGVLAGLVKQLEMQSVSLVGVDLHISLPADVVDFGKVRWEVSHDYKWQQLPSDSGDKSEVFCFVSTDVLGKYMAGTQEYNYLVDGKVLYGGCMFVVRYKIPSSVVLNDETLMLIAGKCASIHAAPYVKSYLDAQLSQMGVKGVTLPLSLISGV